MFIIYCCKYLNMFIVKYVQAEAMLCIGTKLAVNTAVSEKLHVRDRYRIFFKGGMDCGGYRQFIFLPGTIPTQIKNF